MKFKSSNTWAAQYDTDIIGVKRGTVGIIMDIGWGEAGGITEFCDTSELYRARLYSETAVSAISDILKNAERVLCCRPAGGSFASCVFGRARYMGSSGNRITVACRLTETGKTEVITYVNGDMVDVQTVGENGEISDNDYVIFNADTNLTLTSGIPMSGGRDAKLTSSEYISCLDILSRRDVDILVCAENDHELMNAFENIILRERERGGFVKGVTLGNISVSENSAVTSVYCADGDTSAMVYYISGLLASLPFYASAVGKKYGGNAPALAYKNECEAENAPKNRLILASFGDNAYIFRDNNTSNAEKYIKNVSVRLCDEIRKRIGDIFGAHFLGKAKTDESGLALLREETGQILRQLDEGYGVVDSSASSLNITAESDGTVNIDLLICPKPRYDEIELGAVIN